MWYFFSGFFYSPSYLLSKWTLLHLESMKENAQYVDMPTYCLYNTEYIWKKYENESEDSMKNHMFLGRLDTTSFGNLAYMALHLKRSDRREHIQKIYDCLVALKSVYCIACTSECI
jgi:hypothetical protein